MKETGGKKELTKIILICAVYLALSLSGMTMIKYGHQAPATITIPVIGIKLAWQIIAGIMMYGCSFLIFVLVISSLQISIVIPLVSGMASLFTTVVGLMLFKEKITPGQGVGIALVLIGTFLIGVFK